MPTLLDPETWSSLLDFLAEGCHFVVDVVVTTVYRSTIIKHAALVPGIKTG